MQAPLSLAESIRAANANLPPSPRFTQTTQTTPVMLDLKKYKNWPASRKPSSEIPESIWGSHTSRAPSSPEWSRAEVYSRLQEHDRRQHKCPQEVAEAPRLTLPGTSQPVPHWSMIKPRECPAPGNALAGNRPPVVEWGQKYQLKDQEEAQHKKNGAVHHPWQSQLSSPFSHANASQQSRTTMPPRTPLRTPQRTYCGDACKITGVVEDNSYGGRSSSGNGSVYARVSDSSSANPSTGPGMGPGMEVTRSTLTLHALASLAAFAGNTAAVAAASASTNAPTAPTTTSTTATTTTTSTSTAPTAVRSDGSTGTGTTQRQPDSQSRNTHTHTPVQLSSYAQPHTQSQMQAATQVRKQPSAQTQGQGQARGRAQSPQRLSVLDLPSPTTQDVWDRHRQWYAAAEAKAKANVAASTYLHANTHAHAEEQIRTRILHDGRKNEGGSGKNRVPMEFLDEDIPDAIVDVDIQVEEEGIEMTVVAKTRKISDIWEKILKIEDTVRNGVVSRKSRFFRKFKQELEPEREEHWIDGIWRVPTGWTTAKL